MLTASWRTSTSTTGIVALAGVVVAIAAVVVCSVLWRRLARLQADQRLILGAGERDVVAHAADLERSFQSLNDYIVDVATGLEGRLGVAETRLGHAITHRAVVRYDAYNELSGRQSTSIALLDDHRSGLVLSSIHHRDQARLYVKQVTAGRQQGAALPRGGGGRPRGDGRRGPGRCPGSAADVMRIGYLGPPGTFSEEALRASLALAGNGAAEAELVPLATVHAVVAAIAAGDVDRAIAPIENSLEGSVTAAVDALVHDAPGVRIIGEIVLPVRYRLLARPGVLLQDVRAVLSHPQALAQCARFLRERLPAAEVRATTSTAEAVRVVAEADEPWAALGTSLAAELYRVGVLAEDVEDDPANATRFVWLGRGDAAVADGRAWKSTILFSGDGDGEPGWLVRCLSEFAFRGVNLTRIESRPAKRRLGHYVFLVDCAGRADAPGPAAEALAALQDHADDVRLLGAYPAAERG